MKGTKRVLTKGTGLADATPEQIEADIAAAATANNSVFSPMDARVAAKRFFELFKCQRGGACCTREMSTVKDKGIGITYEEAERLAAIKGMSPGAFVHEYCQPTPEKGIAMKYPCTVAKAAITWLEEHR